MALLKTGRTYPEGAKKENATFESRFKWGEKEEGALSR